VSESVTAARDEADAKAWFYLDHRHDIETWVSLRAAARQLLDNYLIGVTALLEDFAEDVNAAVETHDLESGSWPRGELRRSSWLHKGIPDVSIVIEWERARLLTPGSNEWPYIAVRLPLDAADDVRRRQISDAMKPLRSQLKGSSSPRFPFWRYVELPHGDRVDPDAYVEVVLANFRQLWETAAPILDALHPGGTEPAGGGPQVP